MSIHKLCFKCHSVQKMIEVRYYLANMGRYIYEGKCAGCGRLMVKLGPSLYAGRAFQISPGRGGDTK